jgi:hypothetical protein
MIIPIGAGWSENITWCDALKMAVDAQLGKPMDVTRLNPSESLKATPWGNDIKL